MANIIQQLEDLKEWSQEDRGMLEILLDLERTL